MMTLFILFIGVIGGSLVTFLLTKHYYERDMWELKREVDKMRELNLRMLWKMEKVGFITLKRDKYGNITDFDINTFHGELAEPTSEDETIH